MKNILVVEDNNLEKRLMVFLIRKSFEEQVYIFEASNGIEALDIISKNKIDMVITDLVMPHIEGMELIRKIKIEYPQIENILAISGKNPYYLFLAKKLGVKEAFTKPLDKDKFVFIIRRLLDIETIQRIAI
jgi:two-component system, response regulator YesN